MNQIAIALHINLPVVVVCCLKALLNLVENFAVLIAFWVTWEAL